MYVSMYVCMYVCMCIYIYMYILRSVRRYLAVVLTVTINVLQQVHAVDVSPIEVQSQLIDVWLLIDEVSISHTATHRSR